MADLSKTLEPLRSRPGSGAILCDIDGTLAPIVDDPEAATVPPAARQVLADLAARYGLVACVTGRRASAARRMVGVDSITYAGNHGLELLAPGEREPSLDPALGHRGSAAAGFAARLDWDRLSAAGLRLEDKGPIQAIHWRTAPDQELAAARAKEVAELVKEEGLVAHFGRKVLEVRPVAEIHKGAATRRLIERSGMRAALFGGDDRTDLDAFAALRDMEADGALDTAVCVGVHSPEAPEEIQRRADLVVDGTDGFLALLQEL